MDPDDILKDGADGAVPLNPNDPDNLVKLSENEDRTTQPPDDVDDTGSDHQQKDTNVHPEEAYDVGEDAAAGIDDPLRDGPPTDYSPEDAAAEGFDADGTEEAEKDSPSTGVS